MRIETLKITNMRAIQAADLEFGPGINLLVGVNGVGKTTALDAIRVCMSRILPAASASRGRAKSFVPDDIRIGTPYMEVGLRYHLGTERCEFERREWRKSVVTDDPVNLAELRRSILNSPRLSDRARNLLRELETTQTVSDSDFFEPSRSALGEQRSNPEWAPLCIFFGVGRSVPSNKGATRSALRGGQAAAYVDALVSRPLYLAQIAQWMRAQQALAIERPASARHFRVLVEVAKKFVPELSEVRVGTDGEDRLLVDKSGLTLDAAWLSDGERGVLAIALDLARRLSQANPDLDNPAVDAGAVVLIDEIDLHLHPRWQSEVMHSLTTVFPKCQFIATTHSPLVLSEVPHSCIQFLAEDGVHSPTHSFGVDSSRILEELMGVSPRPLEVEALIDTVSSLAGEEKLGEARKALEVLAGRLELGENDPEVVQLRTLLDFMEGED